MYSIRGALCHDLTEVIPGGQIRTGDGDDGETLSIFYFAGFSTCFLANFQPTLAVPVLSKTIMVMPLHLTKNPCLAQILLKPAIARKPPRSTLQEKKIEGSRRSLSTLKPSSGQLQWLPAVSSLPKDSLQYWLQHPIKTGWSPPPNSPGKTAKIPVI